MNTSSIIRRLLCIALLGGSTSCATVFSGTHQRIPVTSDPSGARVRYACDGEKLRTAGETPVTVSLLRSADRCRIAVDKDGYDLRTITLSRQINGMLVVNAAVGVSRATVYDYASGNCVVGEPCDSNDPHSLSLALLWSVVPAAIDLLTGAAWEHQPARIDVTLQPRSDGPVLK